VTPQTHRQILIDTAREYGWQLHVLPKNFRFYDLVLRKDRTELRFRFDKRDRISVGGHAERGEYTRFPTRKKLDYAIEVLRGPLRPPVELGLLRKER
jgi:hypothetical protein